MTELSTHLVQWMPLAAAFGFIIGEAYCSLLRHRKRYQDATEELRETLKEAATFTDSIHRALKQQRGVINDIHKQMTAVTKALPKRPS
jgi:hypothetical protein